MDEKDLNESNAKEVVLEDGDVNPEFDDVDRVIEENTINIEDWSSDILQPSDVQVTDEEEKYVIKPEHINRVLESIKNENVIKYSRKFLTDDVTRLMEPMVAMRDSRITQDQMIQEIISRTKNYSSFLDKFDLDMAQVTDNEGYNRTVRDVSHINILPKFTQIVSVSDSQIDMQDEGLDTSNFAVKVCYSNKTMNNEEKGYLNGTIFNNFLFEISVINAVTDVDVFDMSRTYDSFNVSDTMATVTLIASRFVRPSKDYPSGLKREMTFEYVVDLEDINTMFDSSKMFIEGLKALFEETSCDKMNHYQREQYIDQFLSENSLTMNALNKWAEHIGYKYGFMELVTMNKEIADFIQSERDKQMASESPSDEQPSL